MHSNEIVNFVKSLKYQVHEQQTQCKAVEIQNISAEARGLIGRENKLDSVA